jgi:hypothetical protein
MSLKLFPRVVRGIAAYMAEAPDIDGYLVKVPGGLPWPELDLTIFRAGLKFGLRFSHHFEQPVTVKVDQLQINENVRRMIDRALAENPAPKSPSPAPLLK